MLIKKFLALCLFLLGFQVYAQTEIPGLRIKDEKTGKTSPLRIQKLDIQVKVLGRMAVTTLTYEFINETPRVLEGEFVFPLAEGRSVSRFALEVNGAGQRKMSSGFGSRTKKF